MGAIAAAAVIGAGATIGSGMMAADAQKDAARMGRLPPVDEDSEIAARGINALRFDAFPRILETRREFDPEFLQADARQIGRGTRLASIQVPLQG